MCVLQPDKDRELLQQKVHMTQVMFEQAKEDFEVGIPLSLVGAASCITFVRTKVLSQQTHDCPNKPCLLL